MTDIAIVFDPKTASFDFQMDGPKLLQDDGLSTAILLSWFCDKRADPGDVLPEEQPGPFGLNKKSGGDRRGWWGDFMTPQAVTVLPGQPYPRPAFRLGSRFWLFRRQKITPQLINAIQAEAADCLAWMKTDGIASKIAMTAAQRGNQMIVVSGRIDLVAGSPLQFRLPVVVGGGTGTLPADGGGGDNALLGVFVLGQDKLS